MKLLSLLSTVSVTHALKNLKVTGHTADCISISYEGVAPFNVTWQDWRVDNRDRKLPAEQVSTNDEEYDVCGLGHPWFWEIIVTDAEGGSSFVRDRVDGHGIRIHDVWGDEFITGVFWWGINTCYRQFRVTFKCPLLGEVWDQNPDANQNNQNDHSVMHYKVWDVNQDHQTFDFVVSESFQAKNYMTYLLRFDTWEQPCWDGTLNATDDISHWDAGHEHQGDEYPGYYNRYMHQYAEVTEPTNGKGDKIEEVIDDAITLDVLNEEEGVGTFVNGTEISHEQVDILFRYDMATHDKFARRICAATYNFQVDPNCEVEYITPGDYFIQQGAWTDNGTGSYTLQMDNVYQTDIYLQIVYTSASVEAACTADVRTPAATISFPTWIE